ncbi:MAG: deoxyguanosinetriphosphate triphosphohydrolase [Bradyrhizobiaceae bacterium]|nr:MAG: deoxyguanosinetriphosphate triphosphohydrolase [Bradyrhizobiaceae bacterium]
MSVGMAAAPVPYGCDPLRSRGRRFSEPPSRHRSPFRRDCDRVIHSTAFRRLKHKTQVFIFHEGDHYRTRLTHTLEVAQIARALARQLGLDEDLTETLALAHDLGHTPFGHAGERALDACLKDHGGFDHNAQSLRVVTELERRYPDFDGLNLTWEALEGIVKHNGPLIDRAGQPAARYREEGIPLGIANYVREHDLDLATYASLEAQVAAIADDIAYNAHDIDDGLRAGLFTVDDLGIVPLISDINARVAARYPSLDEARRGSELVRELISHLIEAVYAETGRRAARAQPQSADDVRHLDHPLAVFPADVASEEKAIKSFLWEHMYRHERVMRVMKEAEALVADLFHRYHDHPSDLPAEWASDLGRDNETGRARRIGDFIAGMTDNYAMSEYARLFDSPPELR